ncbi:hypothetical protein Q8A73_021120 [Channa argus]|nr:hypothetical protein Q8A73_021120 [Channa argus]
MDWMDREAIQHLYGGCKGRFNTVFDWTRKEMTPYGKIVICFNTYFMRDGWYRNNRTRYEDPVTLQIGWRGIPLDGVDANVHVWSRKRDVVYVFKGTQSWRYDNENNQVFQKHPEGHQKDSQGCLIPMTQPFMTGGTPSHPKPLGNCVSTFGNLVNGKLVYAFDVEANSLARGFPKNIRDVFPPVVSGDHPDGNIDAAYFSYTHKAVFLLQGTRFWQVVGSREFAGAGPFFTTEEPAATQGGGSAEASLDATRINEISHADGAQATAAPER